MLDAEAPHDRGDHQDQQPHAMATVPTSLSGYMMAKPAGTSILPR